MEEKIIEIIENISREYWDKYPKIEITDNMSKEELEFINKSNHKASQEIIELFKNK